MKKLMKTTIIIIFIILSIMLKNCSSFQLSLFPKSASSASVSFLGRLARRTSTLETNGGGDDDDEDNNKNSEPSCAIDENVIENVKTTVKPKAASKNYWKSATAATAYTSTSNSKRTTKTYKNTKISDPKNIQEPIVSSVVPLSILPSQPWMKRNNTAGDSSNHVSMEINTNDGPKRNDTTFNSNDQQIDALMDTIFNNMSMQLPLYRYSKPEQPNGTPPNGEPSPEEKQRWMEEKLEEHIININGKVESRVPMGLNTTDEGIFLQGENSNQVPSLIPNDNAVNVTIALDDSLPMAHSINGLDENSSKRGVKEILLDKNSGHQQLLCPSELLPKDEEGNIVIPYPKSLSPTAILEFMECPQSFMFQYLLGLRQPTSLVLAKGSMCHHALQRVFDLEPSKRSLSVLQNLFRTAWQENRLSDTYKTLFETEEGVRDVDKERSWGREGLALLENYWKFEDASKVQRPNPLFREQWVVANLTVESPPILIRGIVDRLDMVRDTKHSVAMRLIDYKSGKAPDLKYSRAMNEKIERDKFFQLLIYAWLLHASGKTSQQLPLRYLRLLYLTSEGGTAQTLDWDLGATVEQRELVLSDVRTQLERVWKDMKSLIDQQDLLAFRGCHRSFCWCHVCRGRVVPGTVWTPEDENNSGSRSSSDTAMTG
jgi:RecB family exonuclease